jgi:hypothetical protein
LGFNRFCSLVVEYGVAVYYSSSSGVDFMLQRVLEMDIKIMDIKKKLSKCFFLILASVLAANVVALEESVLELREGFEDTQSGARVERIDIDSNDHSKTVTVSIPKSAGEIEEVIVSAPALEPVKKPKKQSYPFKFIKDFDNDRYGLVIFVGPKHDFPVRLYFAGEPEQ